VRDERDVILNERAIARIHGLAAIFGDAELPVAGEPVGERRPLVSDDPERLPSQAVREGRGASGAGFRHLGERTGDL